MRSCYCEKFEDVTRGANGGSGGCTHGMRLLKPGPVTLVRNRQREDRVRGETGAADFVLAVSANDDDHVLLLVLALAVVILDPVENARNERARRVVTDRWMREFILCLL